MKCSGALSEDHDPELGTEEVDIGLFQPRRLIEICPPCLRVAIKLGMVDRRRQPLTNEEWDQVRMDPDPITTLTTRRSIDSHEGRWWRGGPRLYTRRRTDTRRPTHPS